MITIDGVHYSVLYTKIDTLIDVKMVGSKYSNPTKDFLERNDEVF